MVTLSMQTFLPYPDFAASVALLDWRRLNKQRIENYQILKSLLVGGGLHGGWTKHPASRQWKDWELCLFEYQEATINEWVNIRGHKDITWEKSKALLTLDQAKDYHEGNYPRPEWIGNEAFHRTHRDSLVYKDPTVYASVFPDINPAEAKIDYIWFGPSLQEADARQEAEDLALEMTVSSKDGEEVQEFAFMPS